MKQIITLIFGLVIFGLFYLVRDRNRRISRALWIPVFWLFIAGSRPSSVWLDSAPTEAERATEYYSGSPIDSTVFEALEVAALVVIIRRRKVVGEVLRGNWPILVFFGYCLLSVAWSDFPIVSIKRLMKGWGDLMMVLIMLTDPEPVAAVRRVLIRTGFWLLSLSVLFIQYYPDLGVNGGGMMTTPTYTGVTTNKNELGFVCMIWGLGFLWCFLDAFQHRRTTAKGRQSSLLAYGAMVVTAVWLLRVCDSATSLTCLTLGGILMVLTSLRTVARRPALVHVLVIIALCGALFAIFVAPSLLTMVGRKSTLTGRTELWQFVLPMAGNPVFGTGFESFWLGQRLDYMWRIYWWHPNEAHDGYLEIFLNLGWLGIALFASFVLRGYGKVVAGLRRMEGMSGLRLAYIVAALVYNVTESASRELNPVWIALLFATITPLAFGASNDRPVPRSEYDERHTGDEKPLWFDPLAVQESER
jgi:exopolysaccharide production protein ExoQ